MKQTDIRPLGAGDGIGYYWVQKAGGMFGGQYLALVAINEVGEVKPTGLNSKFNHAALTEHEAVVEHLSAGISQADADLERRRREAPEPEPEPEPMDRATQRFLTDGDEIDGEAWLHSRRKL
jgi:hypothetical protein